SGAGSSNFASDMREQRRQGAGGHALDAGGLAEGQRSDRRQLLPNLAGEPADGGVVQVGRQREVLVPPERGGVGSLAVEVAGIARVGLDLLADLLRPVADLRPALPRTVEVDAGISQQLQQVTPLSVGLDRKPEAGRLGRRQAELAGLGAGARQLYSLGLPRPA